MAVLRWLVEAVLGSERSSAAGSPYACCYYADLPVLDEEGTGDAGRGFDGHMRAWDSAAAALTQRGDMLVWTCGFAEIVMLAREHGWRSPLVDAVMWDEDHTGPFRVGAVMHRCDPWCRASKGTSSTLSKPVRAQDVIAVRAPQEPLSVGHPCGVAHGL